eukprot:g32589.t1
MGSDQRFLAKRTAKVAALARATRWQQAVYLALVETPVQDARLHAAAVAALGRGLRWAEALALGAGRVRDTSSLNAALGACERARRWSVALRLWKDTHSRDVITFNTAMALCASGPPALAAEPWSCAQGGFAILQRALEPSDVDALLLELPGFLEGGTVRMEEQSKGNGGYDYLRQLPLQLSSLKEVAYEMFLPTASELLEQHGLEVTACGRVMCNELDVRERRRELPPTLEDFEALCERKGENRAHRDIYGEVSYPLQMLLLLSQPGQDFTGGRFFTLVDGRKHEAQMSRGDLLVFRTSCKHGCTVVRRGRNPTTQRMVVGLQFAKRALRRERLARRSLLQAASAEDSALNIFHDMCAAAAEPDVVSYNALIKACAWRSWRAASEAFKLCEVVTLQAITSCPRWAPQPGHCELQLGHDSQWTGPGGPSMVLFGGSTALLGLTDMSAALHDWTGHWEMALKECQRSQEQGVSISTDFLNAAISACSSFWRWAIRLFGCAVDFRAHIGQVSYAAALSAFSDGRFWLKAMSWLREARHFHCTGDDLMTCFNTAMSCCEDPSTWNSCLQVLDNLLEATIKPDQKSYRSPIRGTGYGTGWRTAIGLLESMVRGAINDDDHSALSATIWAAEVAGLPAQSRRASPSFDCSSVAATIFCASGLELTSGLAKLQRKSLRTAFQELSRYQGGRAPASDLPPLTGLGSINAQQPLSSVWNRVCYDKRW